MSARGIGLILGVVMATAGCASTSFNASWPAPDAQPVNYTGQKVAALVMSPDIAMRMSAEAALARELTSRGANGVPAYTVVPKELIESKDETRARQMLQDSGVAAVVAMRAISKEQQITQSSGYWSGGAYAPYGSFWGGGYWGYGWGAVYSPGYLRTDTILIVETLLYDMKQDKLLWAGQSQTTNPSDLNKFIHELVSKAAGEVRKFGVIQK